MSWYFHRKLCLKYSKINRIFLLLYIFFESSIQINPLRMLEDLCQVAVSINFKSEDGQFSDYCSSPQHTLDNPFKVKCFKCYGTNRFNCSQCNGMQTIYGNHPLAQLLGEILNRKMNAKRGVEDKQQFNEQVYPIKEEQEDNDEKKQENSFIELKCQFMQVMDERQYTSETNEGQQVRTSECFSVLDLITTKNGKMQFPQLKKQTQDKLCNNCCCRIQNCYSLCKTCDDQGIKYWICDQCSDNNSYAHYSNHYFQAVIDYDSYKNSDLEGLVYQDFKDETVSQEFQEGNQENEERFMDELIVQCVLTANLSIALYLQEKEAIKHVGQEKISEISRVKFQIDNLFSSCGFETTKQITKAHEQNKQNQKEQKIFPINKRKLTRKSSNAPFKQNSQQFQSMKLKIVSSIHCTYRNTINHSSDYIFEDYKCDNCNITPIVNIRHHCLQCQDFDLCETCFHGFSVHSQHQFKRIDGYQIREKAIEKIFKNKDINMIQKMDFHEKKSLFISISQTTAKKGKQKKSVFNKESQRMSLI